MVLFKNKEGHNTLVDIKKLSKVFSCSFCSSSNSQNDRRQEKNSTLPQFQNLTLSSFVTCFHWQTVLVIAQRLGQIILIILNFFYNIGTLALIVSYAINFGHWWISFIYFLTILLFHASLLFRHCSILER